MRKKVTRCFALVGATLAFASCAAPAPVADANGDGKISDDEMVQFRRKQEVQNAQRSAPTPQSGAMKSVRTAREIAGTANTFRWFSTWF